MNECYRIHHQTKPHTDLMNFFIKTLQNFDKKSFQEYSTENICFNRNLYNQNGRTLNSESYARGCFVEKKILYLGKVFRKTCRIGGLLSKRQPQEPLQNIGWSTLQRDLAGCRS